MAIQRINLGTAPSGTGGDTNRTAFKKIDDNFTDSANAASRLVGTAAGNVIEVGAFGLGGNIPSKDMRDYSDETSYLNAISGKTQFFYAVNTVVPNSPFPKYTMGIFLLSGSDKVFLGFGMSDDSIGVIKTNGASGSIIKLLTNKNTTVDSNGLLKAASPIVKLFTDKIECNDEAKLQPISFEKLGVGDYLIKGSLGFAQEGWYIETPKDANGNVLVAVVYEQLANNDISVKTYDYMLNKKGRIVPDLETPLDIPSTRWIDLRLQALPKDDIQPLNTDETVNTNAE